MKREQLVKDLSATRSARQWKRIGMRRRAGITVPLFSVYSKQSLGIGEIDDLRLVVDWCVRTGHSIVQLLPMNEMGPLSCPYDSISSIALEPVYLSVRSIEGSDTPALKKKITAVRKRFPAGKKAVDYGIKHEKLAILWELFSRSRQRQSAAFETFVSENGTWLNDFALYKVLKRHHEQKPWYEWDRPYRERDRGALKRFFDEHEEEVLFYQWVQWHLFRQFTALKEYAVKKNVLMKGDLPILVSRDSADVWAAPHLFKLDYAAGAPPDMYCAKGQRWGMPPYNWEQIAAGGYAYLKQKLAYARNFYDIIRIDHVVGVFRIWSIPHQEPLENGGLNGRFDPPDENTWEDHGRRILSAMVENTDMLFCAEDLGAVPKACPAMLREFGIPGNEVQRWAKDWAVRHDFLRPDEYRTLSVTMLSTHDTTNWAGWWDREAGTVDEDLFRRKCADRGIPYEQIRNTLFDVTRSSHGRLRWHDAIDSPERYRGVLGKPPEQVKDFLEMYQNTYAEKKRLWSLFGLSGEMKEKCSPALVGEALGATLESRAVFCVHLVVDWLLYAGLLKGDPYAQRINRPGVVDPSNWAWTMPLSLEQWCAHPSLARIRKLVAASKRS